MPLAFVTTALLAFSLGTAPASTGGPSETTQTLTLRTSEGGHLLLDGRPCGDTTLVLTNAHVAARAGAASFSVALPDGRVFYKGDVDIVVRSERTGTVTLALSDGEAVLATVPEEG